MSDCAVLGPMPWMSCRTRFQDAAVLHKRDVALIELYLKVVGVVAAAEEHRHVAKRHAFLA